MKLSKHHMEAELTARLIQIDLNLIINQESAHKSGKLESFFLEQ